MISFFPASSCPAMHQIYSNKGYFWYDQETEEQIHKEFLNNYSGNYHLVIMYDNIGEGYIRLDFKEPEDRLEFFLRYGDKFY